jgi:hypothetical protein
MPLPALARSCYLGTRNNAIVVCDASDSRQTLVGPTNDIE